MTDIAMPGASVYGAAKSAVKYFISSLANEFKDHGSRINVLIPDRAETNLFNDARVSQDQ